MSNLLARGWEDAIHAWAEGSSGVLVDWADQNSPRLAHPFGTLKVISGPENVEAQPERASLFHTESATITILGALEGQRITVRAGKCAARYVVQSGDTDDTARDGLAAAINAQFSGFGSAVASGAGTLALTETTFGGLDCVGVNPPGTLAISAEVRTLAEVVTRTKEFRASLTIYTREPTAAGDTPETCAAHWLADMARGALDSSATASALRVAGLVSRETSTTRNVSAALEDGKTESIAVFDVRFRGVQRIYIAAEGFETVCASPVTLGITV